MAFENTLKKTYEPTLLFSIEGDVEGKGSARKYFPTGAAGSFFSLFKVFERFSITIISPQTKNSYKLDSFLSTCSIKEVRNILLEKISLRRGIIMNTKRFFTMALVVVSVLGVSYGFALDTGIVKPAFKVTDPKHPDFNPHKFRFSDYSRNTDYRNDVYESELYKALKLVLKPGMTEQEVDKILLNDPHVKKIDIKPANEKNLKNYFYKRWYMHLVPTPNRPGFNVFIEYSGDGKLIKHTYRS